MTTFELDYRLKGHRLLQTKSVEASDLTSAQRKLEKRIRHKIVVLCVYEKPTAS